MRYLLTYLELWLSGAGLLIIGIVPLLVNRDSATRWLVAAITAVGVGLVHGLIFWIVRRRQQQLRNTTIHLIQGMLKDRINNRLTLISGELSLLGPSTTCAQLDEVHRSIQEVSQLLNTLSEETLRDWQATYHSALEDLPHNAYEMSK